MCCSTFLTTLQKTLLRGEFLMSKEESIELLKQENAQLRAKVTALENVVNGINSFLSEGDDL